MTIDDFKALVALIEQEGTRARAYFDSDNFSNEIKQDGSVVTEIDTTIEERLREYVTKRFPEDTIIGEEGDTVVGTSSFVWYIDPIDGTDSFVRKIPFCGTSVARLGDTDEGSLGIIHNPITSQTFASFSDGDVFENKHLCTLTADSLGGRFVIALGSVNAQPWMKPAGYELMKQWSLSRGRMYPYGSTALSLAYVSANRIDAYLGFGLNPHDFAAGLFLAQTTGASISIFENDTWHVWEGSIKSLCAHTDEFVMLVCHKDVQAQIVDFVGNPRKWADV